MKENLISLSMVIILVSFAFFIVNIINPFLDFKYVIIIEINIIILSFINYLLSRLVSTNDMKNYMKSIDFLSKTLVNDEKKED